MDKTEPREPQQPTPEKREGAANTGNGGSPPVVYTEEHVKEAVNKAVREALTAAGRDEAARKRASDEVEAARLQLEEQREAWKRQQEEAEEQAAADDPEALKALRRERQAKASLEQAERKLREVKNKEAELAAVAREAQELKRERLVNEIAARYSVDPKELGEYADLPRERLEKLAAQLPKVSTAPTIRTSSGQGGSPDSWDTVRAAYIKSPENPAIRGRYLEMRKQRER